MRTLLLILAFLALAASARADWAEVPLPVLVDEAELIVVGKVTKVQDGGFFTLGPGKADHIVKHDVAVVEVSAILKTSLHAGKPKEVQIGQPAKGFVNSATILFRPGQQGIWLLTRNTGTNAICVLKDGILVPAPERHVYWARHPSQFQPEKEQQKLVDLIAARAKQPTGKAVDGLVARAELIEADGNFHVRLSLKNESDKPLRICEYVGKRPLKVEWQGPDGAKLKSKHYDWLAAAFIGPLAAKDFVEIPAGATRFCGRGLIFTPPANKTLPTTNAAAVGQHKVTLSFVNEENGKQFGFENVWTGTVTSNEVIFTVK